MELPAAQRFTISTEERNNYFGQIFDWIIFPLLLFGLLWFIMFRPMQRAGRRHLQCRQVPGQAV